MSIWHVILSGAATLLPAFGRRIAGGGLSQWVRRDMGDTTVRLLFGISAGAALVVDGASWAAIGLVGLATFLTSTIGMFGGMTFGLPQAPQASEVVKAGGLLLHSAAWSIATAIVAVNLGMWFVPVLIAAPAALVPYWVGWKVCGLTGRPSWPMGFQRGNEWGEFGWGLIVGIALLLAVVLA